jgi:hypothetical protein
MDERAVELRFGLAIATASGMNQPQRNPEQPKKDDRKELRQRPGLPPDEVENPGDPGPNVVIPSTPEPPEVPD